jgi:hypothetical protein
MLPEKTEFPENIVEAVQHFIGLFSRFHEAMPDENQHIFRQVIKQIKETKNLPGEAYLKGKTGMEPVWTFEKSGVKVSKRVFHPGRGEHETGADFVLSKKKTMDTLGITAVQTKRNRGKSYFEFDQRDLSQLNKFSSCWRSAYYLMVDETVSTPIDCFITIDELKRLIAQSHTAPPIRIPNSDVRQYCRGPNVFYDAFYKCRRGSEYTEDELVNVSLYYVKSTTRVLIELLAEKR